jgi:hypothetical protein
MSSRRVPFFALAVATTVVTVLFLVLSAGALGIIGEGGRPDRVYAVVLGVLAIGTLVARFRARAMALALGATAAAQALVALGAIVAVLAEVDDFAGASVIDLVGINAMFVGLFGLAAWLFLRAAGPRATVAAGRS